MFKLFDISLRLNGFKIEEAKKNFEQILKIPEADFEAFKIGIAMFEDELKDFLIEEYQLKFGMIE